MKGTLGAVLAGGVGSRMGGAKVCADLHGQPLIAYPLATIAEAGLETLVLAKPSDELPPLGVPVLREPEHPRHPLCGIVAALRAGEGRPTVVVACDIPFASAGLIRFLAEVPEPLVVPALDGRPQPLLARYEPALLPELEAALEREEPLARTVEALEPRLLGEEQLSRFGDPRRLLFNVNGPADMREAEALLTG
ncbi:MAG TPA: molybdenum cofactor guanylyltransferase [Solirubrobacterales bacterium]|nr:molybdenum cofactor guanylyltransferase [Solirubrobacterales bacterium]